MGYLSGDNNIAVLLVKKVETTHQLNTKNGIV